MKKTTMIAILSILSATTIRAAIWQADLPGGSYVVDTSRIVSISTHEFVVDAGARVTELTIATGSSVTGRFYFIEPLIKSPLGRGQELIDKVEEKMTAVADRLGQDPIWKRVVKNYPIATHAHTVEYRLDTKENIQRLYNSVYESWRKNRDINIKIASETSQP